MADEGGTTTLHTGLEKNRRERSEKKILRAMIWSLEKSEREKWGKEKFKNQGSKNWNSTKNPGVIQLEH